MSEDKTNAKRMGGLECLVLAARFHHVEANMARLQHEFDETGEGLDAVGIVRAAKSVGFKAGVSIFAFRAVITDFKPKLPWKRGNMYLRKPPRRNP